MYRAVLFDLDGTLLPINTGLFIQKYIQLLTSKAGEVMDSEIFKDKLLRSTEKMVKEKNPEKTNEEVFMEEFFKGMDGQKEKVLEVFDEFYEKDFEI